MSWSFSIRPPLPTLPSFETMEMQPKETKEKPFFELCFLSSRHFHSPSGRKQISWNVIAKFYTGFNSIKYLSPCPYLIVVPPAGLPYPVRQLLFRISRAYLTLIVIEVNCARQNAAHISQSVRERPRWRHVRAHQ